MAAAGLLEMSMSCKEGMRPSTSGVERMRLWEALRLRRHLLLTRERAISAMRLLEQSRDCREGRLERLGMAPSLLWLTLRCRRLEEDSTEEGSLEQMLWDTSRPQMSGPQAGSSSSLGTEERLREPTDSSAVWGGVAARRLARRWLAAMQEPIL